MAGEKFADADLIGCPYRVIVSEKTLAQNKVEVKRRGNDEIEMVEISKLVEWIVN
jgi:prolyl-tRNA synthetase